MAKSINVKDNEIRITDTVNNVICIDTYYCDRIVVELADGTEVIMSADIHNYFMTPNGGVKYVAVNVMNTETTVDMVVEIA